jgi:hypothetical protein
VIPVASVDKPGFQVGGRFYAIPTSFRLGDPVLIEELTGLAWNEFVDRLPEDDEPDDAPDDPVVLLGLLGVAVWQQNPRWRRDKVIHYVQQLDMGEIEAVTPEPDDDDGGGDDGADADPPVKKAGARKSKRSASSSNSDTDSR